MTSGSDDLEPDLSAKQRGRVAYGLGWVLYWACLALALGMPCWFLLKIGELEDVGVAEAFNLITLPALITYGIGRAFRYVLSGE